MDKFVDLNSDKITIYNIENCLSDIFDGTFGCINST